MPDNIIRPAAFNRPDPDDPPFDPDPATPAALRPILPRCEYSLFDLARRLGLYEHTDRQGRTRHTSTPTIIRHVRDLIELRGLPAPLGLRILRGRDEAGQQKSTVLEGAAAVHQRSRWDADLIDTWLREQMNPKDRALAERTERTRAQIALDHAADHLFDAPARHRGAAR